MLFYRNFIDLCLITVNVLAIRKLEISVLKFYLVNAVASSKNEKVLEFFIKMATELQGQPEWKDWFGVYILKQVLLSLITIDCSPAVR